LSAEMTAKRTGIVASVCAICLGLGLTGYELLKPKDVSLGSTNTSAVTAVEVGDLVTLDSDGHAVTWVIEPEVPYVAYGSETEHLVTSFKHPGQYYVYAASITADAGTAVTRYPISVKSVVPPVPRIDVPDRAEAKALAASFRLVADSVEARLKAGILVTPEQITKETREANQKALGASATKWESWFAKLGAELQAAKLVSLQDHITKWRAIATQLEEASK
jgi:hypothetical protein